MITIVDIHGKNPATCWSELVYQQSLIGDILYADCVEQDVQRAHVASVLSQDSWDTAPQKLHDDFTLLYG